MSYQIRIKPHQLQFAFDARTSRGAMRTHQVYYVALTDDRSPLQTGIGECAPLPGLSPDFDGIEERLKAVTASFNAIGAKNEVALTRFIEGIDAGAYPSVKFALETAATDLKNGARRVLFPSGFTSGEIGIPINGLVWMGDKKWMQQQIAEKIDKGFTTIKLKIGALNFAEELDLITWLRKEFSERDLTIRVDANGAFTVSEALEKLGRLSVLKIHSIEQPVKQGQWEQMAALCEKTPVPIALDEELIGPQHAAHKSGLLTSIKPHYIILKPTLHGGLQSCREWITEAENQDIGWWMTSALESNIGLNAISQCTATYAPDLPQGLGTGQLYHNNTGSPLEVKNGYLFYDKAQTWNDIT